jgi:hypothetical protein
MDRQAHCPAALQAVCRAVLIRRGSRHSRFFRVLLVVPTHRAAATSAHSMSPFEPRRPLRTACPCRPVLARHFRTSLHGGPMALSSGTATAGTIGRHSVTVTASEASGGSRPYSHVYRSVELASSQRLRWQCNACPGDPWQCNACPGDPQKRSRRSGPPFSSRRREVGVRFRQRSAVTPNKDKEKFINSLRGV